MIKIHNFPASFGDTFLVCINEDGWEEVNILIDCGREFSTNAQKTLEKMGENKSHKIDRFIITHFDDDHIAGLYKFLQQNGRAENPNIIEIQQIWLNTFRHLQFFKRESEPIGPEEIERLELFKLSFPDPKTMGTEQEIGAKQAMLAGRLIYANGYSWNTDFAGEACTAFRSIQISENVRLHILTPTVENLKNIEAEFIKKLKSDFGLVPTNEDLFDDAFELYVKNGSLERKKERSVSYVHREISLENMPNIIKNADYYPDTASGNGSSVSFILETLTKRMLFLADAHAEDVIASLKKMFPDKQRPLIFDAIKVAHHGSFRNNKPELFTVIDSEKFIFSTNGKHQSHVHPDIETIAHIITRTRPEKVIKRTLYFNHDFVEKQEHLKAFQKDELRDFYNYEVSMVREIEV
jgi:ribonuclease BN (tRNA processing enzyme)